MTAETTPASHAGQPARPTARKIVIQTHHATREIALTPSRMALLAGAAVLGLGWTLTATAGFVVSALSPEGAVRGELELVEAAYEDRIATLDTALAEATRRADDTAARLDLALGQIVTQQAMLQEALASETELRSSIGAMRDKLAEAVAARDSAEDRARELTASLTAVRNAADGAGSAEEMEIVLSALSDALHNAVRERDTHRSDLTRLESEIATMELRMQVNADRQERLVASLEDAVQASFGPLESMFEKSGLNVDTLISGVRQSYNGMGGPETLFRASLGGSDPELDERFSALMSDMDRMNMMRIAAAKIPYTMPVRVAHRFTSGFGTRRDPFNGGRRAHNGVDFAAGRGTPIEATADGTVTFAGWQSGYGNFIKIRHAYGFETHYAHLNKIHVKVGDRIARGDHIGDMGTTGRSTGVHLHYEVHLGGKPVNPMTYIRAGRDVF
ncbi:peptidoglycan DD-metalloendopeptidase family protein [Halovulum dunhuangense]|uniref:Peptidoglycan DD-metalloendopeptidase family protein n=1 Tax=Halovulum dunhuangense TaxID=1505036 RepID=A0A849L348_9RHOB|nr:DUF5930 domain-containing protein [Halovulum dunhuangense]NNU80654.1 peptidoglycan DD-metalloendopeptidase family protein [Halovulum dunhuangense]